jgi:hypothetical protein
MIQKLVQALRALWPQRKESIVENNTATPFVYTEEQLMARLKFFIGVCLALTLTGIVFVVLYSLIFVTQPLNAISPIDQKFFELIVPIATFLTGTLSGIMLAGGTKEETEAKLAMMKQASENQVQAAKANPPPPPAPPSAPMSSGMVSSFAPAPMSVMTPAPAASQVTVGFGGKLAPPPAPQPEI